MTPQHENRSAIGCQKKVNAHFLFFFFFFFFFFFLTETLNIKKSINQLKLKCDECVKD